MNDLIGNSIIGMENSPKHDSISPSNSGLLSSKDNDSIRPESISTLTLPLPLPSALDKSIIAFSLNIINKAIKEKKPRTKEINAYITTTQSAEYSVYNIISDIDDAKEEGKLDYLVNLMTEKCKEQSFFFIPQLCLLVMNKPYTDSLSQFILTQCVNKMKFSVIAYWMIASYGNYSTLTKKEFNKYISLIEMTLVNGSTKRQSQRQRPLHQQRCTNNCNKAQSYQDQHQHKHQLETDEQLYNKERDKEFRTNYFNIVLKFYNDLKVMCEKLKGYPKENKENPKLERNTIMKAYLKMFNKRIEMMYEQESEIGTVQKSIRGLFRGFLLPFDDTDSSKNSECNVIVNFLPDYSSCFNTKSRVPVKVVFECVKEKDLVDFDVYYSNERCCFENHEDDKGNSNSNSNEKGNIMTDSDTALLSLSSVSSSSSSPSNDNIIDDVNDTINTDQDASPIKINRSETAKSSSSLFSFPFKFNFQFRDKANSNGNCNCNTDKDKDRELDIEENGNLNHQSKSNNSYEDFSTITTKPFGEQWSQMESIIKAKSKYGLFPSYSVKAFMAKSNDDLRQELLTMQLIKTFNTIFKDKSLPLNLHPYEIVITSPTSGLIEYIPNTLSIDAIKKTSISNRNLNYFFRKHFNEELELAQRNFARSLAAYSLITYIINIKDRHNGNILLDMYGNLIHIDYGFILGISPGNMGFERAPFKLTKEYIDILDGEGSTMFNYFKSLMLMGFSTVKEKYLMFEKIIEIAAKGSNLPCFDKKNTKQVIEGFKARFHLNNTFEQDQVLIGQLINTSMNNWRTNQYDKFQKMTNGICP